MHIVMCIMFIFVIILQDEKCRYIQAYISDILYSLIFINLIVLHESAIKDGLNIKTCLKLVSPVQLSANVQ